MRYRQGAQRRFEGRTIRSDVEAQNRRIGIILLALIVIVSVTTVIGAWVLD